MTEAEQPPADEREHPADDDEGQVEDPEGQDPAGPPPDSIPGDSGQVPNPKQ